MSARIPTTSPTTKCKLRLLKLERIKDYLLMEQEFVTRQEQARLASYWATSIGQLVGVEAERPRYDDVRSWSSGWYCSGCLGCESWRIGVIACCMTRDP